MYKYAVYHSVEYINPSSLERTNNVVKDGLKIDHVRALNVCILLTVASR